MKIYTNIIQGTDEWKELRHGKIGGSSIEKIMANADKPVSNNAIFYDIFAEQNEDFEIDENEFTSTAMRRGVELEPQAVAVFENVFNKKTFEIGWAELNDFVGISPDRLISEVSENVKEALEIKCPNRNTYAKYLLNNNLALEDYAWQLAHYFYIFPHLERLFFMIYRPENKLKNFICIEVGMSTIIRISAKKTLTIAEMLREIDKRINELSSALKSASIEFMELPF